VTDLPVVDQTEADKIAKAVLDGREGNFIQAEAEAGGNPKLRAGTAVKIKGVGERFGGKYLVTRSLHRYTQNGYEMRFWCSGGQDNVSMSKLLQAGDGKSGPSPTGNGNMGKPTAFGGLVGVVTNTNDPDDMVRVKVKLPMITATGS